MLLMLGLVSFSLPLQSAELELQLANKEPQLTNKEIMNSIITPMTTIIWGAYQLQTDAEWKAVEDAALAVIAAGQLLASGGAEDGGREMAAEEDWQNHTARMIEAARKVIAAVAEKNEEALSEAGNNDLYPPCEECHQKYQSR